MVPPGAVAHDDDVGRVVAFAEYVVVRGYDVLQCRGEGVLRDGGETVARCDEHVLGVPRERRDRAEQLCVKLDEREVGGVPGDVAPAVDEEDDAGVRALGGGLGGVAVEGKEIDGDALGRLEQVTGEERVWFGGGRGDLDANRDVCRDAVRIRTASALVYGLGGGA